MHCGAGPFSKFGKGFFIFYRGREAGFWNKAESELLKGYIAIGGIDGNGFV